MSQTFHAQSNSWGQFVDDRVVGVRSMPPADGSSLMFGDFNNFCLPGSAADYEEVIVRAYLGKGDDTEGKDGGGDDSTVASVADDEDEGSRGGGMTDDEDEIDALFSSNRELRSHKSVSTKNKALYDVSLFPERFVFAFNSGDIHKLEDLIDEHCSCDFVFSTPGDAYEIHGLFRYKEFYGSILEDLPDAVHNLEFVKLFRDRSTGVLYMIAKVNFAATRCAYSTSAIEKIFEAGEAHILSPPPAAAAAGSGSGSGSSCNTSCAGTATSTSPTGIRESKDDYYAADRMYKRFSSSKRQYRATGTAYSRYTLNDHNEISRLFLTRKFNVVEEFSMRDLDDEEI